MHYIMALFMLDTHLLTQGRDLVGLAAAVLAAVMAANASWILTDKVMARRAAGEASED
ncbi:hypothetical protein [Actinocorallia longicatena]|uniref:Uncharacterized protein n=1 Tax=Actinocorallia longicatena TaxID=111803 RepID=A0ABP6QFY6_9ACTN